jgi:hypothetical protein
MNIMTKTELQADLLASERFTDHQIENIIRLAGQIASEDGLHAGVYHLQDAVKACELLDIELSNHDVAMIYSVHIENTYDRNGRDVEVDDDDDDDDDYDPDDCPYFKGLQRCDHCDSVTTILYDCPVLNIHN